MNSQNTVMKNAADAYKTAGLSANAYMETVTSFSASLLQSLGGDTEEAALVADQAIIDMSDNANKMGTDISNIQNAYRGFAKQNFTMLDNLSLGYGGTREEMQRLLADASALSGIEYDISSFADITEAIHVMQEEMGIAGTTAKEAMSTIEGSVNATKAAWTNLVTGLADDNADFDTLVNNFVESASTAAGNILPRVETAITGVGDLIEQLLPVIVAEIPNLINTVLPSLLNSGASMIIAIMSGLSANMPTIISGAITIVNQFVSSITEMMPQFIELAFSILEALVDGISENIDLIVDGAIVITEQLITSMLEMLPDLIEMGLQIIVALALGIAEAIPELIPVIIDVVLTIVNILIDNIPLLLNAAIQLLMALVQAIPVIIVALVEALPDIITNIIDALIESIPLLVDAGVDLFMALIEAIPIVIPALIEAMPQIIEALVGGLLALVTEFFNVGIDFVSGLWDGICSGWDWLVDKVTSLAKGLINSIYGIFGIDIPFPDVTATATMGVAGALGGINADANKLGASVGASLDTIKAGVAGNSRGLADSGASSAMTFTANFYDTQTEPDAIYKKFKNNAEYGLAGAGAY